MTHICCSKVKHLILRPHIVCHRNQHAVIASATRSHSLESADLPDTELFNVPNTEHLLIEDNFLEDPLPLRLKFESTMSTPLKPRSARFVWDPWHVPGQYDLLRTPADHFFGHELHDRLVEALLTYGESHLGCRGISPLWLSCYTDGHRQELHTDSPHGPWAFVYSLTRYNEQNFTGGETQILQPQMLNYWPTFDSSRGLEMPNIVKLVEPNYNRLTVFDPRLPHGVRPIEGTRDPLKGRLVVHGWFTSPSPFYSGGGLTEDEATPALNDALDRIYSQLESLPPVIGIVTVQLSIEGMGGSVTGLKWLSNTLVARSAGRCEERAVVEETLLCIADGLLDARFPKSGNEDETIVTLPFIFE